MVGLSIICSFMAKFQVMKISAAEINVLKLLHFMKADFILKSFYFAWFVFQSTSGDLRSLQRSKCNWLSEQLASYLHGLQRSRKILEDQHCLFCFWLIVIEANIKLSFSSMFKFFINLKTAYLFKIIFRVFISVIFSVHYWIWFFKVC